MARILLLSSNITQDPYPVYPLGMAMIAHDLLSRGHEVIEWDYLAEGESLQGLTDLVKAQAPDVIGLSLRNIDNCSYNNTVSYLPFYQDIIRVLRSCTKSPIVLGGAGYSLFPEVLLKELGADYGIEGEGEVVFSRLAEELTAGRTPVTRILKNDTPLTGGQTAVVGRNPVYVDYYLRHGGMMNIQTKRGCPLRCAYCSYPTLEGRAYRYRPAGVVADEIQMLIEKYHADYYFIADSVFNDPSGHYLEIIEEIVRRGIQIPYMAYLKPDRFRVEDIELMKRSGLKAVEWGTDCSTDRTLKGMGKHFSWSDVEESNRLFSSAGISCAHFIIFGGPEETEQTVEEGLSNIDRLNDCVVFASTGVRVIPGTPIHRRAVREEMVSSAEDLIEPFFYFSGDVTAAGLDQAIRKSFSNRMDRVYPFEKDADKVRAFHKLGYRGPIWDMLLGKGNTRERRRKRVP